MGFRKGATALGIETGDVGADSRKVGLELGEICAVLGENCVRKVGERHRAERSNHLWLCESCGFRHSNDAERRRSRPSALTGANSRAATAPGTRKTVSVSWSFLNVCVSQLGSVFSRTDRCGRLHDTPTGSTEGSAIHPSFIVFVIFVLNAPYFLLGIASQRNLRYNVPNR